MTTGQKIVIGVIFLSIPLQVGMYKTFKPIILKRFCTPKDGKTEFFIVEQNGEVYAYECKRTYVDPKELEKAKESQVE